MKNLNILKSYYLHICTTISIFHLSIIGKELGLDRPADELLPTLEEKYGKLLKSVPGR